MATLLTIRADIARMLTDPNNRTLKVADLNRLINQAQDQWVLDVEGIERSSGIVLTSGVNYFAPPSDFIRPRHLVYRSYWPLEPHPGGIVGFGRSWGWQGGITGWPYYYEIFERVVRLYPGPSSSSLTGTLGASISATDSTITLGTGGSNFQTAGIAIVDSEQIEWFSKDATGTQLLNARRGASNTTAATHASGATVTATDIRLLYYSRATTLVADADVSDIPDRYTHAFEFFCLYMAALASEEKSLAQEFKQEYQKNLERMVAISRQKQRQSPAKMQSIDRKGYGDSSLA